VLGYQHDGKLTLYSTTDYSVVWESGEIGVDNFGWSNNPQNLYINKHRADFGLLKYSYPAFENTFFYPGFADTKFINFNKENSRIICSYSTAYLYLLDNTITSITDPFFTTEYKTALLQNQTNNNYQLQIEAIQPNIVNYFISDAIGNILIPNLTQNLEQGINSFDIDIANLPSGNYFLQLTIAGHSQTIKFIVVR
jgi:hypothetical protein